MFSGIIEHQAKILSREWGYFRVENTFSDGLCEGQSIAHDGACMTLTHITPEYYDFFTMEESIRVTNFWWKQAGDFFNVERSLKLGDRIDGHFVTGHVDTVGKVILTEIQGDGSLIFGVSFDSRYNNLLIEKWSVTLNGVSLTLIFVRDGELRVSLIPLTQAWTNLGKTSLGDPINIEFDMMGKYIQKYLKKS